MAESDDVIPVADPEGAMRPCPPIIIGRFLMYAF